MTHEQQKIEELLKPRFEVIADYPYNPWLVGEVLVVNEKGELIGKSTGYPDYDYQIMEKDISKYPHLFKPLQWWEKRSVEEMPDYVKTPTGKILMITTHFVGHNEDHGVYFDELGEGWIRYDIVSIATLAEYTAYINSKK